jgi:DNA-binding winged helix-turn-helix (wHTH) protein/tetratricopeptide (TPR) repeat protein
MGRPIQFAEFRLDPAAGRLWRHNEALEVTPKTFALLEYLTSKPQQLLNKETIMNALWGDTFVGDAVLKVAIAELRKVLGDDAKEPRFIETVHRRGYRFVAELQTSEPSTNRTTPIGRDGELAQLNTAMAEALTGRRQTVFVTGEPGIGKSTLLEAFLNGAPANCLVARGQCLQQYGEGEPYLPVFNALNQLSRTAGVESFVPLFRRHAPTWVAQMPSLVPADERESVARTVLGATRERMLREMAEAIEALAAERPLILALEDLHWSDGSTVDLVSALAWRTAPARFLLIGTYRPVEVIVQEHPIKALKQDLLVQSRARELPLDLLSEADVDAVIETRCPGNDFPTELVSWIHRRTSGNPLFLANVLDFAVRSVDGRWSLRAPLEELQSEVPDSLRQMIGKQVERLTNGEQEMLEAASVAGIEFPVVAASAGLGIDPLVVEEMCEHLARRGQFLAPLGLNELPDGTVASRYRFLHPLYQTVLYQRIGPGRRIRLHQRIGEQAEVVYGDRAGEIASELAMQFESARDYRRAVKYLRLAAERAVRCYANREAVDFLTRALECVAKLAGEERLDAHLHVLEARGFVHRSTGAMQLAFEDFTAVADLARTNGNMDWLVRAMLFQVSALSWFDHETSLTVATEAVALSVRLDGEVLRAHACGYSGYWHLVLHGWRAEDAAASRVAIRVLRSGGPPELLGVHLARFSYFESLRSEYGDAAELAEEAMVLALRNGDSFEYILSQYFRVWALFLGGRWGELRRELAHAVSLATENGHKQWMTLFSLILGWLYIEVDEFGEARKIASAALDQARAINHPLSRQMALVQLGFAHLGLREPDVAEQHFRELSGWLQSERVLMDWIWWIPLCRGLSRCALARKEFVEARRWADEACARASVPGERTWLALGHLEQARIAKACGEAESFDAHIRAALAFASSDVPLAAWRVHEFAAAHGGGERHGQEMAQIISALRDSLDEDDALRKCRLFQRLTPV